MRFYSDNKNSMHLQDFEGDNNNNDVNSVTFNNRESQDNDEI